MNDESHEMYANIVRRNPSTNDIGTTASISQKSEFLMTQWFGARYVSR